MTEPKPPRLKPLPSEQDLNDLYSYITVPPLPNAESINKTVSNACINAAGWVIYNYAAPAYAEIERLRGELDESNRKLEHAKLAIILAKEQYWNKCYQGSGNVQAMTLNKFTAFMEEALKSIGVES